MSEIELEKKLRERIVSLREKISRDSIARLENLKFSLAEGIVYERDCKAIISAYNEFNELIGLTSFYNSLFDRPPMRELERTSRETVDGVGKTFSNLLKLPFEVKV